MVLIATNNITRLPLELLGRLDNPIMFTTVDGCWSLKSEKADELRKYGLAYFYWMSVGIKSRKFFNNATNLLEIGSWK